MWTPRQGSCGILSDEMPIFGGDLTDLLHTRYPRVHLPMGTGVCGSVCARPQGWGQQDDPPEVSGERIVAKITIFKNLGCFFLQQRVRNCEWLSFWKLNSTAEADSFAQCRKPSHRVLHLPNHSGRSRSAPSHQSDSQGAEQAGRNSRMLSEKEAGAAHKPNHPSPFIPLPPWQDRSIPTAPLHEKMGPVGLEALGGAAAPPRWRPTEVPPCADDTDAISGSPDSHFACQQICISKIHPLLAWHARSILGSWEGNCAPSLQCPARDTQHHPNRDPHPLLPHRQPHAPLPPAPAEGIAAGCQGAFHEQHLAIKFPTR